VHYSQAERRVPFFKGDGITTVNLGFCLLLFLSCESVKLASLRGKSHKNSGVSTVLEAVFGGV
jgi:hypothetical protein